MRSFYPHGQECFVIHPQPTRMHLGPCTSLLYFSQNVTVCRRCKEPIDLK